MIEVEARNRNQRAASLKCMKEFGDSLSDEKRVDGAPVELIDKGQSGEAGIGWVDTRIAHDRLALVGQDAARSANLLPCAEHLDAQLVRIIFTSFTKTVCGKHTRYW